MFLSLRSINYPISWNGRKLVTFSDGFNHNLQLVSIFRLQGLNGGCDAKLFCRLAAPQSLCLFPRPTKPRDSLDLDILLFVLLDQDMWQCCELESEPGYRLDRQTWRRTRLPHGKPTIFASYLIASYLREWEKRSWPGCSPGSFISTAFLLPFISGGSGCWVLTAGVSICSENLIFSCPTFWPN